MDEELPPLHKLPPGRSNLPGHAEVPRALKEPYMVLVAPTGSGGHEHRWGAPTGEHRPGTFLRHLNVNDQPQTNDCTNARRKVPPPLASNKEPVSEFTRSKEKAPQASRQADQQSGRWTVKRQVRLIFQFQLCLSIRISLNLKIKFNKYQQLICPLY